MARKQWMCSALFLFVTTSHKNTVPNGDTRYTNLVYQFSVVFSSMKVTYGGYVGGHVSILDEKFLQEDVANLSMLSYENSIKDSSFSPMKTYLLRTLKHS